MNEKTSAVTISDPPQSSSAARILSVRASLRVNQSPATSPISAAGISQEISVPNEEPNIRSRCPAVPPKPPPPPPIPPPPAAPPPPHRCRDPPKIRPRPL